MIIDDFVVEGTVAILFKQNRLVDRTLRILHILVVLLDPLLYFNFVLLRFFGCARHLSCQSLNKFVGLFALLELRADVLFSIVLAHVLDLLHGELVAAGEGFFKIFVLFLFDQSLQPSLHHIYFNFRDFFGCVHPFEA